MMRLTRSNKAPSYKTHRKEFSPCRLLALAVFIFVLIPPTLAPQAYGQSITHCVKEAFASLIDHGKKLWSQLHSENRDPAKICASGAFVMTYKNKNQNKTLTFIAAKHGGPSQSPETFRSIDQTFKELEKQPDTKKVTLLEGIAKNDDKTMAAQMIAPETMAQCLADGFAHCSETHYAAHRSKEAGASYRGVDQSSQQIIKGLKPSDSKKDSQIDPAYDHVCFQSLILFFNERRRTPQDPEGALERAVKTASLSSKVPFNANDFKICFLGKMGRPFNGQKESANDFQPKAGESANFFENYFYRVNQFREQKILGDLQNTLKQNDHVVLVLGSGHYFNMHSALEKLMEDSTPEVECKRK